MTKARKVKGHQPKMCSKCGQYPADTPSDICAGCEAYKEHQSWM